MKNITKYTLKTSVTAVVGLILLFSGLTYVVAPQTDGFELNSINPFGFVEGFVLALGFGLGVPVWLSLGVLVVISAFIFMIFRWIARKVIE